MGNSSFSFQNDGKSIVLTSPTVMPNASGFLWNSRMMINMNCRGYAVAQFMQPEPAKYSYAPNIEAKTFMQPEHAYFSHHPGRFFYIKDEDTGEIFSAPYEPVRCTLDKFNFITNQHEISWLIEHLSLEITLTLSLTVDKPVEIWSFSIKNLGNTARNISIYPYFSIGYMSWLNQSAVFDEKLGAIVATCVSAYQKLEDYPIQKNFNDKTFLLSDTKPTGWSANQKKFEGEGGLHNPSGLNNIELLKENAIYETPAAVLQYRVKLQPSENKSLNFVFGAAKTNEDILAIKKCIFGSESNNSIEQPNTSLTFHSNMYEAYVESGSSVLEIDSPDENFNHVINHWLPRQMFYHGDVNRLSTDPQTRNYLQDNMGMCFIDTAVARQSFITSLSQQSSSGVMPEGILLHPDAKLKYINQIPHADHSVWVPVCLSVYLSETNDCELLNVELPFTDTKKTVSVKHHIDLAMETLIKARDHRGLSFIEQGDWCDPMNMVGYKGKGVSAWLSLATAYALNLWADICEKYHGETNSQTVTRFRIISNEINEAVNTHLWDGDWYGRGITDDNVVFGVKKDEEGRIYLNPQSWSILSGAASNNQIDKMTNQVSQQLSTPFGVMMLAPSYTKMREDVGRLTQKHPGVSENGAVYNHAAVFYAYSLYTIGQSDDAFDVLYKMLSIDESAETRGQLPNFIPNYYRGAYYQFPEQAGKSSQLFNTGTIAWYQRCIVEGLCGLKGELGNLIVNPQLPKHWNTLKVKRYYQGAHFFLTINRADVNETIVHKDGNSVISNVITDIEYGASYNIDVKVPR